MLLRGRFGELCVDVRLFGEHGRRLSVVIRRRFLRTLQFIARSGELHRCEFRRSGLLGTLHRCFRHRDLLVRNGTRGAGRECQYCRR